MYEHNLLRFERQYSGFSHRGAAECVRLKHQPILLMLARIDWTTQLFFNLVICIQIVNFPSVKRQMDSMEIEAMPVLKLFPPSKGNLNKSLLKR
jgi:hypothetical protein